MTRGHKIFAILKASWSNQKETHIGLLADKDEPWVVLKDVDFEGLIAQAPH